jgi:hypothetical protein
MSSNDATPVRFPAARGLHWLKGGLTLLRARPARLLLLGLVFQLWLGLSQVPVLGLLVLLSVPAMTAGLLQAFDAIVRGHSPPLATLFISLRSPALMSRLILLGVIMLAGGMLAVSLVFSGAIAEIDPQLIQQIEQGNVEALQAIDPAVLQQLLLALVAGMAVTGTLSYFAVPLIWFGGRKLGAALLEGLRALLQCWQPLLVLGLALAAMAIPVGVLIGLLYGMAIQSTGLGPVFMALTLLLVLAFQLLLFATQYIVFRDVFKPTGEDAEQGSEPRDQLVA